MHFVGEAGEVDVEREPLRLIERTKKVVVMRRHDRARLQRGDDPLDVLRREPAAADAAQKIIDVAIVQFVDEKIAEPW